MMVCVVGVWYRLVFAAPALEQEVSEPAASVQRP
jgi:hypothetical protein